MHFPLLREKRLDFMDIQMFCFFLVETVYLQGTSIVYLTPPDLEKLATNA
jgi:hypothetical protein